MRIQKLELQKLKRPKIRQVYHEKTVQIFTGLEQPNEKWNLQNGEKVISKTVIKKAEEICGR